MIIGSRLAWIVIASVAGLLVAGFAVYFAVNVGGSPGEQAGIAPPTATTPLATTPVATEPPTATAPAPTEGPTVPPATATDTPYSLAPQIDCGGPRYRLNVDKLAAQPQLAQAIVTVIDESTVQIAIDGLRLLVSGWGEVVRTGGPDAIPQQLSQQITAAIDAVRYEC